MKLSREAVKNKVVTKIYNQSKDDIPSHYGLLCIIFDLIEEREKYRDHRA